MNNPNNLDHTQRSITPGQDFNKGINYQMSKGRRKAKQERHRKNISERRSGVVSYAKK